MTARAARRPRIVRCPGCEKPAADGTPTTTIDVVDRGYGRSPSGHTYFKEVPGKRVWHTACLDAFNAQNERLRADLLLSQDISMCCIARNAGILDSAVKAMRDNGRTEDHIAAVLAAVEEGRKH